VAFDGEKVMATNLVHILDSTKEKSKTQVGNRLHPQQSLQEAFVPLCSSLASVQLRGETWAKAARTGNSRGRKEVRKRQTRPQPAYTQPYNLQESKAVFPKIFTVSLS
jgi:hypothetical protein